MKSRKLTKARKLIKKPKRNHKIRKEWFAKINIWSEVDWNGDTRHIKEFFLDWYIRVEKDDGVNRHIQTLDIEFLEQQKFYFDNDTNGNNS